MITLHTFPGTKELESFSPFCMKVEVYLKAQGLPYRAITSNPRSAPKGKFPYIEDGGTKVADSSAIFDYLEKKSKAPMDAGLDAEQRARAHVVKRTFEESFYWVLLWSRWVDDLGWSVMGPRVARMLPAAVRWFVPGILRGKIHDATKAHGYGRHTRDEIYALGFADLEALSTMLGDRPFFLGDEPHTIDVVAYAFLGNLYYWEKPTPLVDAMKKHANLAAFVERARERFKAGGAPAAS